MTTTTEAGYYIYGRDHILLQDGSWTRRTQDAADMLKMPLMVFGSSIAAWSHAVTLSRGYDAHVVVIRGERVVPLAEPDWQELSADLATATRQRDELRNLAEAAYGWFCIVAESLDITSQFKRDAERMRDSLRSAISKTEGT